MSFNRKNRTNHNQIISKTEIALQAIRKYEARSFKFIQKKYSPNNPLFIFRQIDDQYSRLNFHKQLRLDKLFRLQVMPYNQEYFFITTDVLIFPVRIFIKNVKNQGVLYVGYDKQYPGVQKVKNRDDDSNTKRNQQEKGLYDYKFSFNKDIMCILKNQKKKPIRKIYLTIAAKKQLLLCSLKYDYIGYESMDNQSDQTRAKRSLTQGAFNQIKPSFQLPSTGKKRFQTIYTDNSYLKLGKNTIKQEFDLKRSLTQNQQLTKLLQPHHSLTKKYTDEQDQNIFSPREDKNQKQQKKNFIQQNQKRLLAHKRQNSRQIQNQKKEKALQSLQRIKANKQQLQQYKQKQRQIKQQASKLKKFIQHYQKIHKQQKVRDNKITNSLAPLLYLTIFMNKSNKIYNKQTQSILKMFSVRYIIKKFTTGLRKKYIKSILQIANFKFRNQMSCLHIFQLSAKLVLPMQSVKAAKLIYTAFNYLQLGLVLNHSLNQSIRYRSACRIIQRRWKLKYYARLAMLQKFANKNVQIMLKEYPHLRLSYNLFKSSNVCHKICYQYMIDESVKFKDIYEAYCKRVQEIQEFIDTNYKIQQYNKGKPENKKKPYLDIPKKPTPPQQRIFRNLDILQSMLRGWFQIQYKKILKRSSSNK